MTRVVVGGSLAHKPGNGGEAWVRLSWLRGLAGLGCEVGLVDAVAGDGIEAVGGDRSPGARWFACVAELAEVGRRRSLLAGRHALVGASPDEVAAWVDGADLVVDLGGHLARHAPQLVARARRSLFVDLDPGYTQLWEQQGHDLGLDAHTHHATVGLRIGSPGCGVPTDGRTWLGVPPPVVLADWPDPGPPPIGAPFTTVTTWRGPYGPVVAGGVEFGGKHRSFRALAPLPARRPQVAFELAAAIGPADAGDLALLRGHGWRIADPAVVAGTPAAFRTYVAGSAGELSAAQPVYVGLRTGWVSDRTVRYLASGRPAVVEDTGAGDVVPTGEGLVTFAGVDAGVDARTAAAAADAIDDVVRRPALHRRAARALASTAFAADVVLLRVLAHCGVGVRA